MKNPKTHFALIIISAMVWQACDSGPERRNKEMIVKSHDELFNKGNLDFADQVFADDYFGGGPDVVKEFVGDMKAAMPDLQYTLSPIVAEGNQVAWMRTITGTLTKPYMGYEPTGKKVSFSQMVVSTFNEDGKVTEERWVSEHDAAISQSAGVEGVYTYVPPLQGQSIVRNGRYTFLFGPSNGKGPMVGQVHISVIPCHAFRSIPCHFLRVQKYKVFLIDRSFF